MSIHNSLGSVLLGMLACWLLNLVELGVGLLVLFLLDIFLKSHLLFVEMFYRQKNYMSMYCKAIKS